MREKEWLGGERLEINLLSTIHLLSTLRLQVHTNICFIGMDVVEDRTCYKEDSNADANPSVCPVCLSFTGADLQLKSWIFFSF